MDGIRKVWIFNWHHFVSLKVTLKEVMTAQRWPIIYTFKFEINQIKGTANVKNLEESWD